VFCTLEDAFVTYRSVYFVISYSFIPQFRCELCVCDKAAHDNVMLLRKTIIKQRKILWTGKVTSQG
jgi:hypothetical protein